MLSLSTARSSLEEMLESLRRDDEEQTPRDLPPALPPRPKAISRARLPSAKRPLPISFEAGGMGLVRSSLNCCVNEGEREEERGNCLGAKNVKEKEEMESLCVAADDEDMGRSMKKLAAPEDVRNQVLQGAPEVQKCFNGELKGVAVTLQSYVRGEIARKECSARLKKQVHGKTDEQFMAVVQIQSVIRGWLAWKQFNHLRNCELSNVSNQKQCRKMIDYLSEQDVPPEMLPSVAEELRKRVLMAEAKLGQKETENMALREQVVQHEARWSEYEAKMNSMEEMWLKQIASLRMSLTAAKKSLAASNAVNPPRRLDGLQSPRFYESEDTSMGAQTPSGSTPIRYAYNGADELPCRDTNGSSNPVGHLAKEFEERKRAFDEEARAIIEVKSEESPLLAVEALRRLKGSFKAWKKDYKVRLKEAKMKVYKVARAEAEKHRQKWWGKKSKRL